MTEIHPHKLAQNLITLQQKLVANIVVLLRDRHPTRQLDEIGQEYLRDPLHQIPVVLILILDPGAEDAVVYELGLGL